MSTPPNTVETLDNAEKTTVTAHSCNQERTVFTEEGNSDGWIATDLTVEIDR